MARRDGQRKIVVNGLEYRWLRGRSNLKVAGDGFSIVRPLEAVGEVFDDDMGYGVAVTPAHVRALILAHDPLQIGRAEKEAA